MADLPSFADLFRIARDEALIRNGKLTREVIERDGSDANILIAAGVAAADEVIGQLTNVEAGTFLDSARGAALDRLVFDRYGLERKAAAPALGSVTFTTTLPAPATFVIPINTVLQTSDGIQFITTNSVVFLIGSTGPVVSNVRSTLAGLDQQVPAGTITNIVSTIPSQPTDLAVTNAFATAGAADAEADDSYRDRARRFFVTARRGTLKAIEEGALAVAGVRRATAFEVLDTSGRPGRYVLLSVADEFTDLLAELDAVPPAYATQSQALALSVFNSLSDIRPAGTYVDVKVASVVLQAVDLSLRFQAGAQINDVALRARAAVVNAINALNPGDDLLVANLLAALQGVQGLYYTGSEIYSPVGDVIAKPLQVIRSTLGLVQAVAAQGEQPLLPTTDPDSLTIVGG